MASFSYVPATITDLHATMKEERGKQTLTAVTLHDETHKPTDRFMQSLVSRYGFNKSIFRYFSHAETFTRISEVAPSDKLLCCVEYADDGTSTMLACSNPKKPIVQYDDLMEILTKQEKNGPLEYNYDNGVVRSTHAPKFASPWKVGGDNFFNKFMLDTPIDGYSKPSIYLSVLREICTNQAVGQAKAFRSLLSLGKGEDSFDYPITRALEGFNNEEGYEAMRSRLEAAQKSWASIFETQQLYKKLIQMHSRGLVNVNKKFLVGEDVVVGDDGEKLVESSPLVKNFNKMVGKIHEEYGLANLDALTKKRQRTLPAPVRVYDLLNFATEVATHHSQKGGDRFMQGYVGELIGGGDEFDLEGTSEKFPDWRDFLATDGDAQASKQSLQGLN